MYNLCKFSPSVSRALFFLFYLPNKILLYRPLFRLRAFLCHLCPPVTLSLLLSVPSPQGERGPHPRPAGRELSPGLGPQASRESSFCPLPPPLLTRLPSSPASDLRTHPPRHPPKSLRFSFLKCGLKIIFGKLTSLPLISTNIREERAS